MSNAAPVAPSGITPARLRAAIAYWANCRSKGTNVQRAMVERTIAELTSRLEALG
jgi:hypothetical protein